MGTATNGNVDWGVALDVEAGRAAHAHTGPASTAAHAAGRARARMRRNVGTRARRGKRRDHPVQYRPDLKFHAAPYERPPVDAAPAAPRPSAAHPGSPPGLGACPARAGLRGG